MKKLSAADSPFSQQQSSLFSNSSSSTNMTKKVRVMQEQLPTSLLRRSTPALVLLQQTRNQPHQTPSNPAHHAKTFFAADKQSSILTQTATAATSATAAATAPMPSTNTHSQISPKIHNFIFFKTRQRSLGSTIPTISSNTADTSASINEIEPSSQHGHPLFTPARNSSNNTTRPNLLSKILHPTIIPSRANQLSHTDSFEKSPKHRGNSSIVQHHRNSNKTNSMISSTLSKQGENLSNNYQDATIATTNRPLPSIRTLSSPKHPRKISFDPLNSSNDPAIQQQHKPLQNSLSNQQNMTTTKSERNLIRIQPPNRSPSMRSGKHQVSETNIPSPSHYASSTIPKPAVPSHIVHAASNLLQQQSHNNNNNAHNPSNSANSGSGVVSQMIAIRFKKKLLEGKKIRASTQAAKLLEDEVEKLERNMASLQREYENTRKVSSIVYQLVQFTPILRRLIFHSKPKDDTYFADEQPKSNQQNATSSSYAKSAASSNASTNAHLLLRDQLDMRVLAAPTKFEDEDSKNRRYATEIANLNEKLSQIIETRVHKRLESMTSNIIDEHFSVQQLENSLTKNLEKRSNFTATEISNRPNMFRDLLLVKHNYKPIERYAFQPVLYHHHNNNNTNMTPKNHKHTTELAGNFSEQQQQSTAATAATTTGSSTSIQQQQQFTTTPMKPFPTSSNTIIRESARLGEFSSIDKQTIAISNHLDGFLDRILLSTSFGTPIVAASNNQIRISTNDLSSTTENYTKKQNHHHHHHHHHHVVVKTPSAQNLDSHHNTIDKKVSDH